MSVLTGKFWERAGCLQCAAQIMLDADPSDIREDIRRGIERRLESTIARRLHVSQPKAYERMIEKEVIGTHRQMRAELHTVMMDPHECGKQTDA